MSLVTLGVSDVGRAKRFYRDLGLPLEVDEDEVGMFRMEGTWLAVYDAAKLAGETGKHGSSGAGNFSLAHNVPSRADVDAVLAQAASAGGEIVTPARDTTWGGYAGYFCDPEGFLWEVAWNPGLDLT
jgi:catechol 2,3-dioxygenase-like lactoylglutathione lyase family enzyme